MPSYILTDEAKQDLREIAQYTLHKWVAKQLETYRKALNKQLKAIGANEAINSPIFTFPIIWTTDLHRSSCPR